MGEGVAFLFGLAFGSFANVLIDRLPNGASILGRSSCDHCKKTLRWYELIPVVSYALQGGRCRRCKKSLSIQYPLVELATGFLFTYIYAFTGFTLLGLSLLVIGFSLLVILIADLKYMIIPDGMLIAMLVGIIIGFFVENIPWSTIQAHLLSGMLASAGFYGLWRATGGRGMGFGDVKLVGVLGLLLGFPDIVVALYGAFLTGAVVGVILILGSKRSMKSAIPFGPFLIGGALFALRFGDLVTDWWYGFI